MYKVKLSMVHDARHRHISTVGRAQHSLTRLTKLRHNSLMHTGTLTILIFFKFFSQRWYSGTLNELALKSTRNSANDKLYLLSTVKIVIYTKMICLLN